MFLSVVSCNFRSNPLSRLQILQLQFKSSLLLLPCDLLFLLVGVWSLFAMWSLEWTSSPGCCFPFSDFVGLYFSLLSRFTVCFGKTGDYGSISGDDVPAFGVTGIEFISLLISQDSLVCFSIGKGPTIILS